MALSNITIVGGAISNFLFNVGRRHEYFDKPLIDWELILVMEPTTILGALVGGYLNKASLQYHRIELFRVAFSCQPLHTLCDLQEVWQPLLALLHMG